MHVLFKRIRNLDIPIDLQLYLFDQVIIPIALYGCEIWGFENSQIYENLHNDFLRQIINLRKITFTNSEIKTEMKCSIILYFARVCTVC